MEHTNCLPRPARTLLGLAVAAALVAPLVAAAEEASEAPAAVAWSAQGATALVDTNLIRQPNFGRAAVEVFGLNAVIWSYDRYIREGGTNPGFRIGFDSWGHNLESGFNWDDNNFNTNQMAHPYHGNLYFNAARSNGYSFWESVPFAFAGSYMWEFFGEVHNPAMNDWIATSIGGTALGEILHRLAGTVRDNTATGSSRNWKEVGGFFIDPVGGLNRIIDGNWSRQYANPEDRFPKNYTTRMEMGLRTRGEERLWEADTTDFYFDFEFEYGDPFFGDLGKPYDNFDFEFQMTFGEKKTISRVQGSGNLAGVFLKETEPASHILGAFHHYDYINTNALEVGGQSITAGLLSRWAWENAWELRTDVRFGPVILGGISSDYANVSGRDYDYGPGSTLRIEAELRRHRWTWLKFRMDHIWIHAISGNAADHHVISTYLRADVPVVANVGLGADFVLTLQESRYRDYDDVSRRNPQMRAFASFGLN